MLLILLILIKASFFFFFFTENLQGPNTWVGMNNEFIQSLEMVTEVFFYHLQDLRACKMSAVA